MKRLAIIVLFCLTLNLVCYAGVFKIPLIVNGHYDFPGSISFNIDLGVQFAEIHDVRFLAEGDILAIDAAAMFECTLYPEPAKYIHFYTPSIFDTVSTPFNCTVSSVNPSEDWDFLLDGKANGYVGLIPKMHYIPEFPPENISGNITSAFLLIDATPVPEPCSLVLFGLGGLALRRRRA